MSTSPQNRVIMSTNKDPLYYEFWPLVAQQWSAWGFLPTLAVVSESTLDIDESVGDVRYIPPVAKVPLSTQTQISRLILAAEYTEDVNLISDIDMLPMNKEYFAVPLDGLKEELLVYSADAYTPGNPAYPAYPMCYLGARGFVFKEIIGGALDAFAEIVSEWNSYGYDWYTDEKVFFEKVKQWHQGDQTKLRLMSRGFQSSRHPRDIRRIDRDFQCSFNKEALQVNYYIDFHMPRPYNKYQQDINLILEINSEEAI